MATPQQRRWNNSDNPGAGQRGWKKPKLTSQQRNDIVRRLGEGERSDALAAEYQVSGRTVRRLRQYVRPA